MKTHLLSIYLNAGLILSLAAQEPAVKPAEDGDKVKLVETVANLKMIGAALFEFDAAYGAFPGDETAADVREATGTYFKFEGGTSNAYFRQLIAWGLKTEKIFQSGQPINPADNKFETEAQALALGECDFSYFPGAGISNQTADPGRPLAVIPLVRGEMKFDPKPFGGKAVILRADCSVTIHPINDKGEVLLAGKSLFDPAQEYWQGKKPVVAWPK